MQSPELSYRPRGLFIDGAWQEPCERGCFESINPSTGQHLADVPRATAADVDRAVQAAAAAYSGHWGRMCISERAAILEQLADRVASQRGELGMLDCLDAGNSLRGMEADVDAAAQALRYFAGLITEIKGETFSRQPRHLNYTRRQPYGVVGKINPFNHPFRFCAEKAAAALAAGNTVVIKAPEQAPLSSLRFGELCEGLIPPGVINVLSGDGATGAALVRHPLVRRIGFVGSVETGQIIAREAAHDLKRLTLELGGKNPIIFFPDVDPLLAAKYAVDGMNMNRQGQSCSSTSRVLVHRAIHDAVVEAIIKRLESLRVGPPWLPDIDLGPVVSREQHDRILRYIESGTMQGAQLRTGGGRPSDESLAQGFYILPTLFDRVTQAMDIGSQEIFGPVMSVITWSDHDELLSLANGLPYALTASVVSNDLSVALETAEKLECGYVWINSQGRYLGAPYGGWKYSGLEREECFEELLSYTQIKNVNLCW